MKHIGLLITILIAIILVWPYPIFDPLKILIVFFHESSHALATLITGGDVVEFVVVAEQGGHVLSMGGNRFITLSAGYLGSLFIGVSIYLIAMSSHWDRRLMALLGISIGLMSVIYGSNLYVILYGSIVCIAMLLSARYLSLDINDFLLRVIGLTSMMYVPIDIYSDTIERSHLRSDAAMLADEFGGTTVIWGAVWIAISIIVVSWAMIKTYHHDRQESKSN